MFELTKSAADVASKAKIVILGRSNDGDYSLRCQSAYWRAVQKPARSWGKLSKGQISQCNAKRGVEGQDHRALKGEL